jgi:hypothetical protein
MAIRYTDKKDIPENETNDFVEFKEGDATVFLHKDFAESKKEAFRLQGDVTKLTDDSASMKTKLDELSVGEAERLRLAEEERTKGLTAAQRQQEVIDNLTKKVDESEIKYQERIAASEKKVNDNAKAAIVADVAASATEANRSILKRMAAADIEVQADGTMIVLDADGKATPQTVDEYKANLKTRYPSLVSAVQSKGGSGKGGAGGESDGKTFGTNIPGFNELPVN